MYKIESKNRRLEIGKDSTSPKNCVTAEHVCQCQPEEQQNRKERKECLDSWSNSESSVIDSDDETTTTEELKGDINDIQVEPLTAATIYPTKNRTLSAINKGFQFVDERVLINGGSKSPSNDQKTNSTGKTHSPKNAKNNSVNIQNTNNGGSNTATVNGNTNLNNNSNVTNANDANSKKEQSARLNSIVDKINDRIDDYPPMPIRRGNPKSQIGSIALTNSHDITFGDKYFYKGPVTIQQFLIDNRKDKSKDKLSNKSEFHTNHTQTLSLNHHDNSVSGRPLANSISTTTTTITTSRF